jgi:hypothetical protein
MIHFFKKNNSSDKKINVFVKKKKQHMNTKREFLIKEICFPLYFKSVGFF